MIMGRMYSLGRGISSSVTPYRKNSYDFKGITSENLSKIIIKLFKSGLTPSQIGMKFRDEYAIVDVRNISNYNLVSLAKKRGLRIEIPEDLFFLVRRAVVIKKHLKRFPKDLSNKYRLTQIESHINRLSRYYKRKNKIPDNWSYKLSKISDTNV
ncbi:40S ribosomal protein S13 (nucleomorph) [Lotharella oceanica]|uniref:40S ribosomal protein S13 n=1 Tax=Lotharella oceanica TaxID=641309 RepID=A0A060DFF5_9EUKA|nr:40S ribosomal protein S13 [Lotharella oceanica]|mmetsp:Transcript_4174/g.8088  ORF Transcript_4174/g.8088 Transcript_4174/m.8088 type:complete len:154 (+) Transcript_4174:580-1041(+)